MFFIRVFHVAEKKRKDYFTRVNSYFFQTHIQLFNIHGWSAGYLLWMEMKGFSKICGLFGGWMEKKAGKGPKSLTTFGVVRKKVIESNKLTEASAFTCL